MTTANKTIFTPRLDEEHQVLSALQMVGAGFETRGGASLMLTEAVENGVDSIIEARKNKYVNKKEIKIIIDKPKKKVIVIDDGFGFQDVRHVCEKPFKSLKAGNADYTGQFARGLQGFRSFCHSLTYITKRPLVPNGEVIGGTENFSKKTVKISFEDSSIKVAAYYVDDEEFAKYTKSVHGAVAIYENWKQGEFDKLRKEDVIRRVEHHFGELIRKGEIKITIHLEEGKIKGIGPEQARDYDCSPKDYSMHKQIKIEPIPFVVDGVKKGEIGFNLYLTDRGRPDRWNYPYILYKDRPVGDGFIVETDEFRDTPVWESQFLSGYITSDFCQINSLRQALVSGTERDFFYRELKKIEPLLEKYIKQHAKGIYQIRLQRHISDLVMDLQKFLKVKKIFDFKIAHSDGILSDENNEIEIIELSKSKGLNENLEVPNKEGSAIELSSGVEKVDSSKVNSESEGAEYKHQEDTGGHGDGKGESKTGGPDSTAEKDGIDEGHKDKEDGANKPSQNNSLYEEGGSESNQKRARRHKPRGFGMTMQEDEFSEEPSWFDGVASMVVINSGHPRYQTRFTISSGKHIKPLMQYLAELYLWEIAKIAFKGEQADKLGAKYLALKFEYFEKELGEEASSPTSVQEEAA